MQLGHLFSPEKRRLAAAGGPEDENRLPSGHPEGEPPAYRLPAVRGEERHILAEEEQKAWTAVTPKKRHGRQSHC